MIVVKLIGGLGNQMFQYAAGRALSVRHQVPLKLDLSYLNADPAGRYTKRGPELHHFNIHAEVAKPEELLRFRAAGRYRWMRVLHRLLPGITGTCYLAESGNRYHRAFERCPRNTCLDGFWQSEKYFIKHAGLIRRDFTLSDPLPPQRTELAKRIWSKNTVSLHVRRGDYVSLPKAERFHGTSEVSYYEKAVELMKQLHPVISIAIFSDDPQWCAVNLNFPGTDCEIIEPAEVSAHDMYLMSGCSHHIIANSSFSWWGAWLNPSPQKTVIAPARWLRNVNTPDVVPEQWIRI